MTQLASPPPTRRSLRDKTPPRGTTQPSSRSATVDGRNADPGRTTQRGRHATLSGQGFGYLIGWTIASAALPGSGLVAAGRRVAGWLLVALSIGSILGVILFVLSKGGPVNAAMDMRNLALDPSKLTQVAAVALVVGLSWSFVVLLSHLTLRRQAVPTRVQNLLATGLVTALILGISVPAAKASSLALIQKNFLTSVFSAGDPAVHKANAPAVKKKDPWAGVRRVNVLLIGSDAGKGRTGLRPDTMILASVDTKTGDTVMFSLPRNLQRAPFPEGSEGAKAWPYGFGQVGGGPNSSCGQTGELCFLNAVWRTAEDSARAYFPGDKNPGLTATEQAVQGVLGLKVDYYVMLDLNGFRQFIDAIGGVTIDVPKRLPMGGNSEHPDQVFDWIEAGKNQHMDGFHALWFARSRMTTTDYDRMRRQRCVIGAVADQSDPLTIVKNFNKVAKALKENLATDIPVKELKAWGDLAMRIKNGKVRSLPFTNEVITSADPDWAKIQELVQKSLKPAKKPTTSTTTSPSPSPSTSTGTGGTAGNGSTSPTKKPKKPKVVDPNVAQDVGAVC